MIIANLFLLIRKYFFLLEFMRFIKDNTKTNGTNHTGEN